MDVNKKEVVTIFHLYRKDGSALFLHPFQDINRFLELLQSAEIEGRYGREPQVESFTLFRKDLHRMVGVAVRRWVSQRRFIPRFLISSIAFLLVYFFFSFAVSDPLPMIDEVVIGVFVGFLTYVGMHRIDLRSEIVAKRTRDLRVKIDHIYFQSDPFVLEVENELERSESEAPERVLESILGQSDLTFSIENEREAMELITYLDRRFNRNDMRRHLKVLTRAKSGSLTKRSVAKLTRWAESRKIDLGLFVLYKRMKRSLKPVK
jgi:hypothetical protein